MTNSNKSHKPWNWYTVHVTDSRDSASTEPESQLGTFGQLDDAYRSLNRYLASDHGPYITSWRVNDQSGKLIDGK